MAYQPKEIIHVQPQGVQVITGTSYGNTASFRISITRSSPTIQVKVSRYSAVLNNPDIRDRVSIIGLDIPFDFTYGDKIWLEIFYDRNLVPVFGIIKTGPKWTARLATNSVDIPVYPNELEFISKKDISTKIGEVAQVGTQVISIKQKAIDKINLDFTSGFLSQQDKTSSLQAIDNSFGKINDNITKYKQDMSQFFLNAPSTNFKKLFRTYTLIGYSTKNFDPLLDGIIAHPPNVGNPQQNGVNTASKDASFKIIQALNTDLLLADICYQNRYAARLPIPYHRPIYYYVQDGKEEEIQTTL